MATDFRTGRGQDRTNLKTTSDVEELKRKVRRLEDEQRRILARLAKLEA